MSKSVLPFKPIKSLPKLNVTTSDKTVFIVGHFRVNNNDAEIHISSDPLELI